MVSSCTNVQEKKHLKTLLQHNFNRHYKTNKAPFSLSFNPSWLIQNPDFVEVIADWMDDVLSSSQDVFFMTQFQLILWMTNPIPNSKLREEPEFKEKCTVEGLPFCQRPNVCPLRTK